MDGPGSAQFKESDGAPAAAGARPMTALTIGQLFQISMFWFALNSIWGGFEVFQQKRVIALVGEDAELSLGLMELLVMPIAALAMPIAGSISDYTTSRWGRRKPFIVFGSTTTFLAMIGLATSQVFVVLVAFFALLQLTSNIARGPFAGLVPDLVPERQVGIASGLMGLMITLGLMGGYLIVATGYILDDFTWPMIALGGIILAAGLVTAVVVPTGPPGKPREGRTWARVGLETFGTDMLRERSYVFLLASRFCILMAIGFFMNLNILYLEDVFGIYDDDQLMWVLGAAGIGVIATAIGTLPGARISDRVGRKPVIFASTAIGATGMAIIGTAVEMPMAIVGVAIVGFGGGVFLSVDWALMTEIIPKASAGRYMGMSNIVEATNGPLATAVGAIVMFLVAELTTDAIGGRAAMLSAVVLFALGALLLVPVREPSRSAAASEPATG